MPRGADDTKFRMVGYERRMRSHTNSKNHISLNSEIQYNKKFIIKSLNYLVSYTSSRQTALI